MKILKELRKENELTQRELAQKLNLTQATICDWEVSKAEPSIEWLKKLADFFKVSIDYLLEREDDFGAITVNNSLTREEERLLSAFRKLNEIAREKLIEDAEFYAQNTSTSPGITVIKK